MAAAILKETVARYTNNDSAVYSAFVDLSSAFDKVNSSKLIVKLAKTKISPKIVTILKYIYENTFVTVTFNGIRSSCCRVGNGTRQGAVLSPALFNFYMYDVIEALNRMNIGCKLGEYRNNIIAYADDITLPNND